MGASLSKCHERTDVEQVRPTRTHYSRGLHPIFSDIWVNMSQTSQFVSDSSDNLPHLSYTSQMHFGQRKRHLKCLRCLRLLRQVVLFVWISQMHFGQRNWHLKCLRCLRQLRQLVLFVSCISNGFWPEKLTSEVSQMSQAIETTCLVCLKHLKWIFTREIGIWSVSDVSGNWDNLSCLSQTSQMDFHQRNWHLKLNVLDVWGDCDNLSYCLMHLKLWSGKWTKKKQKMG